MGSSAIVVNADADALAFRAGQLVERLLVERGVGLADRTGCSVVGKEHIESGLDASLFTELTQRLRAHADGRTGDGEDTGTDGREAA